MCPGVPPSAYNVNGVCPNSTTITGSTAAIINAWSSYPSNDNYSFRVVISSGAVVNTDRSNNQVAAFCK